MRIAATMASLCLALLCVSLTHFWILEHRAQRRLLLLLVHVLPFEFASEFVSANIMVN